VLEGRKKFIDSIEGAPAAVTTLAEDISTLQTVLRTLEDFLRSDEVHNNLPQAQCIIILEEPLEKCNTDLLAVRDALAPFAKLSGEAKTNKWRSIAWNFHETDISRLKDVLSSYKSTLQVGLALANMSMASGTSKKCCRNGKTPSCITQATRRR
jgi:hypothetical protein